MGRTGFQTSVLMYGAAALGEVDQDTADASLEEALAAGINHVDVAASYGAAEDRLRSWTARLAREGVFLATKTDERAADASWAQVNRSMERLDVDHVDLLQVHAVGDLADLDRATASDGSLASVLRARDEGLTRFVGITGHGHESPATHLEALRRYDFDAVLTPWNHVLAADPAYRADFLALVDACGEADVALRTIKTVSRRNWPGGGSSGTYSTWYEPWDDLERVTAAVAFCLRQPGVCAIATAGDVRLQPLIHTAAERAPFEADDEIDRVLTGAPGYSSPFVAAPA